MNPAERIRDVNADLHERSGGGAAEQRLSPCPCGEEAVWYRADQRPDELTPGKALSAMQASDIYENLCNECFKAVFGDSNQGREGWVKCSAAR